MKKSSYNCGDWWGLKSALNITAEFILTSGDHACILPTTYSGQPNHESEISKCREKNDRLSNFTTMLLLYCSTCLISVGILD
jgi:hypothetical protein